MQPQLAASLMSTPTNARRTDVGGNSRTTAFIVIALAVVAAAIVGLLVFK